MSRVHGSNTKPEERVRLYLFSKGFRYRKNDSRYPGKPDIVLPKYNTVIFVNGCFWHQHPGCKKAVVPENNHQYWEKKLLRNRTKDKKVERELTQLGWKVITIWECELKKSCFDKTMKDVIRKITKLNQ